MRWYQIENRLHLVRICLWAGLSLMVGLLAGGIGAGFNFLLSLSEYGFARWPRLIWLLPAGGMVIVLLYKVLAKGKVKGTDMVLLGIRENRDVPLLTAPLIVVSTSLTHLLGGSSGREGAALQLGGSLASKLGALLKLDEHRRPILVMCGMSAAFAALFGTPVAAAIFVLEVVSVGHMHYGAMVPCTISSFTGYFITQFMGLEAERFPITAEPISVLSFFQTAAIGIACALLSVLFVQSLEGGHKLFGRVKNEFLRIAIGGTLLIGLTLLVGSNLYNGSGMHIVGDAIEGQANWPDFLLKMLFTVITLASGFKGGEIVPSFYIGATFGSCLGMLMGMDPAIAAAMGAISVFCGATNCPIASIIVGVELFGGSGILYYGIACSLAYMFSGRCSLYKEQLILEDKTGE